MTITFWRADLTKDGDVVLTIEQPEGMPLAHIVFTDRGQLDQIIDALVSLRRLRWEEAGRG